MRFYGNSDRISHRCAMPFPDVRHGIAFGAANAQALSRLWRSVLVQLRKQAFDCTKTERPANCGAFVQIALLW